MELFDNTMQFKMPPESDIAALPPEAQKRFEAVRAANSRLGKAITHREHIEERIKANNAERITTDNELNSLHPQWTQVDKAKAWIRSQQEERARERGY